MSDLVSLHVRYAETRDLRLRALLVEGHLPLAYAIAARFRSRGVDLDDLRQVAAMALVGAVERFDPARGRRFSTYATATIAGALKRYFRDRAWLVRPPRRLHDRYLEIQRARDDLTQALGRSPTILELSSRLRLSAEDVAEAIESGEGRNADSLDGSFSDQPGYALADIAGSRDSGFEEAENRLGLAQLLGQLTRHDREVVRMHFLEGLSQAAIARILNTNQMAVSRSLTRALARLRAVAGPAASSEWAQVAS
jgi:RNA polymerase sigma-B factor